jgi:hypothetical protein
MKKYFLAIACVFMTMCSVFSQGKAKKGGDEFVFDKKAGIVTDLSGNTLFTIEYVKSVTAPGNSDYYFKNADGKMLIVFKFASYRDPLLVSQSNTNGTQNYYEIKFFSDPVKESECRYMFLKGLVSLVYDKKLIVEGKLNEEKMEEFILINGSTFSRRRSELIRY